MPEGHTIHRLARDLRQDLVSHPVATEVRQDRFADGARRLDGRLLERTSAHGKHLFLHWDGREVLHIHLGLFGKFRRHATPAPTPSDALRLRLAGPDHAWDLTGPIICDLREPGAVREVTARLGPDPIKPDRTGAAFERFATALGRSDRAVGDLILDQKIVSGIGNVYRAEILHLVGVHPARPGTSLDDIEVEAIWRTTVDQLRLGVRRNRIVTVPVRGSLARLSRTDSVHVYKRERCATCDGPVAHSDEGGRNMFACPRCQPLR